MKRAVVVAAAAAFFGLAAAVGSAYRRRTAGQAGELPRFGAVTTVPNWIQRLAESRPDSDAYAVLHDLPFAELVAEVVEEREAPLRRQAERLMAQHEAGWTRIAEMIDANGGVGWREPVVPYFPDVQNLINLAVASQEAAESGALRKMHDAGVISEQAMLSFGPDRREIQGEEDDHGDAAQA